MTELHTDDLLTVPQAAAVLRRSHKTVRRWIHAGRLETHAVRGDRRIFVARQSVLAARRGCLGHEALIEQRVVTVLAEFERRLNDIEERLSHLDTLRWPKSAEARRIADIVGRSILWQLEHVIDRGEPPSFRRGPVRSKWLEAHFRRFHPDLFSDEAQTTETLAG